MGGHAQAAYDAMLDQYQPPTAVDVCHSCLLRAGAGHNPGTSDPTIPLLALLPHATLLSRMRRPRSSPVAISSHTALGHDPVVLEQGNIRKFRDAHLTWRKGRPCPTKEKDRQYRGRVVVHEHGRSHGLDLSGSSYRVTRSTSIFIPASLHKRSQLDTDSSLSLPSLLHRRSWTIALRGKQSLAVCSHP